MIVDGGVARGSRVEEVDGPEHGRIGSVVDDRLRGRAVLHEGQASAVIVDDGACSCAAVLEAHRIAEAREVIGDPRIGRRAGIAKIEVAAVLDHRVIGAACVLEPHPGASAVRRDSDGDLAIAGIDAGAGEEEVVAGGECVAGVAGEGPASDAEAARKGDVELDRYVAEDGGVDGAGHAGRVPVAVGVEVLRVVPDPVESSHICPGMAKPSRPTMCRARRPGPARISRLCAPRHHASESEPCDRGRL